MAQTPANGALATIIGRVSNNANWYDSVSILVNSSPSTGYTSEVWTMTFRCDENDTAARLSLTSATTKLTYTEVSTASSISTLTISATPSDLASLSGDFVCDLSSESTSGFVTHWAHGRITFLTQPIR